jgi:hypothetical protein
MVSFGIGVVAVTPALALVYFLIKRELPVFHLRVALVPGTPAQRRAQHDRHIIVTPTRLLSFRFVGWLRVEPWKLLQVLCVSEHHQTQTMPLASS